MNLTQLPFLKSPYALLTSYLWIIMKLTIKAGIKNTIVELLLFKLLLAFSFFLS